nr:MAG TPA: hypothetical protein [Caudoviricetes sp.]
MFLLLLVHLRSIAPLPKPGKYPLSVARIVVAITGTRFFWMSGSPCAHSGIDLLPVGRIIRALMGEALLPVGGVICALSGVCFIVSLFTCFFAPFCIISALIIVHELPVLLAPSLETRILLLFMCRIVFPKALGVPFTRFAFPRAFTCVRLAVAQVFQLGVRIARLRFGDFLVGQRECVLFVQFCVERRHLGQFFRREFLDHVYHLLPCVRLCSRSLSRLCSSFLIPGKVMPSRINSLLRRWRLSSSSAR